MNQEIGGALLHNLCRAFDLTLGQLLHLVGGQGDDMRDAGHRGGHGQGQAQHSACRESQRSPHK